MLQSDSDKVRVYPTYHTARSEIFYYEETDENDDLMLLLCINAFGEPFFFFYRATKTALLATQREKGKGVDAKQFKKFLGRVKYSLLTKETQRDFIQGYEGILKQEYADMFDTVMDAGEEKLELRLEHVSPKELDAAIWSTSGISVQNAFKTVTINEPVVLIERGMRSK